MAGPHQKKVLSRRSNFTGRAAELERLILHSKSTEPDNGLLLLSAPGVGATELLKQTYDRLFYGQSDVIPFYFAVRRDDLTAIASAKRFLKDFLLQTVAFRRRDPGIIRSSPSLAELSELAAPSDGYWIDRVIDSREADDDSSFVRNCLSAPLRASANGARAFVIIDDVHNSEHLQGGNILDELAGVFSHSDVPFIFAGRRRFLSGRMECGRLLLEPMASPEFIETLAADHGIDINEQTRDLIYTQFTGNTELINLLIREAGESGAKLENFQAVEKVYADALFGGSIGQRFDAIFDTIAPSSETQTEILDLLFDTISNDSNFLTADIWLRKHSVGKPKYEDIMALLHTNEIVRVAANRVESMHENIALSDYISARFRLEIAGENRATVFGESLSDFIRRAPEMMGRSYRRNASLGLRNFMESFASQEIPMALIDYGRFSSEYKGVPNVEILRDVRGSYETLTLPRVYFAADTVSFYKPIAIVTDDERSAVALGFENGVDETRKIAWIAAEIDSKLEAAKDVAEFWCDRLEMAALMCDLANYRIWLVAPEGFSPEALELLKNRNAFGSSRMQVELLKQILGTGETVRRVDGDEYEIVVPIGEDAELIAAHAVEEIAKRHNFDAKAINQIKTALIEACINAAEHSLSPDGKIYQKITFADDRLNITISNRGLRLTDKKRVDIEPTEGRRGWGLTLMRKLMDEVRIEQVDDGTRISMTKYVKVV